MKGMQENRSFTVGGTAGGRKLKADCRSPLFPAVEEGGKTVNRVRLTANLPGISGTDWFFKLIMVNL